MVISLLLPLANSLKISIDSPDSVEVGEEFKVSFEADSSETFDVKVFIHNSEDEKIDNSEYISEIENNGWQNPWYYIKEAFPDEKEFKIKVTNSPGERELCVRLRKTDSKEMSTECVPIEVKEGKFSTSSTKEKSSSKNKKENLQTLSSPQTTKNLEASSQQNSAQLQEEEKILLNSPTKKTSNENIFLTSAEKKRLWIVYSFTILCVIIIILLALRKL